MFRRFQMKQKFLFFNCCKVANFWNVIQIFHYSPKQVVFSLHLNSILAYHTLTAISMLTNFLLHYNWTILQYLPQIETNRYINHHRPLELALDDLNKSTDWIPRFKMSNCLRCVQTNTTSWILTRFIIMTMQP